MAICNGQQPESLYYDVGFMRKHLAGCLEDKMMRHFNSRERNVRLLTKKVEKNQVYCMCRMPEEEGNCKRMICCDNCKEWYDDECIEIPSEA